MTNILPFQRRDPILKKAALTGMESHTRLLTVLGDDWRSLMLQGMDLVLKHITHQPQQDFLKEGIKWELHFLL